MAGKVFGVVEGFYRRPYTFDQRLDLIDFLNSLNLNTYVYGPKADKFHRRKWREKYSGKKIREFEILNRHCIERSINFVYALSPVYRTDIEEVIEKIETLFETGIRQFSIFFDDIKVPLTKDTAKKQVDVANGLYEYLQGRMKKTRLSFCPTQYHGFKKTEYIKYVAAHLRMNIDTFWTGKNVVSQTITDREVIRINEILSRPVLIWDNIFANDYIPGTILRFPYRRRSPGIVELTRGILLNPMNNYRKSKPLIKTAAKFFHNPQTYDARRAWNLVSAEQNKQT